MDELVKVAVRGIIFVGDRPLLIEEKQKDFKNYHEGRISHRSADRISARCPMSAEKHPKRRLDIFRRIKYNIPKD